MRVPGPLKELRDLGQAGQRPAPQGRERLGQPPRTRMVLGQPRDVMVERVLFPPWTTEWITLRGLERLRAYGIAPPHDARSVTCPQCGSTDTEEVSRFGSTPCKAQWRCRDCLEPFDRFKCH